MKKRIWSIEEKVAILKEVETGGVVETCRKHGIYATTYYSWKRKYDQGGEAALENRHSQQEKKDLKKNRKGKPAAEDDPGRKGAGTSDKK
jgi:transposase-like protein